MTSQADSLFIRLTLRGSFIRRFTRHRHRHMHLAQWPHPVGVMDDIDGEGKSW